MEILRFFFMFLENVQFNILSLICLNVLCKLKAIFLTGTLEGLGKNVLCNLKHVVALSYMKFYICIHL